MGNFEKLKKFFENLSDEEILLKQDGNPYIDIEWLFTEKLDREIIKKAIANFMKRNNPTYKKKVNFFEKKVEDIPGFMVIKRKKWRVRYASSRG